MRTLKEMAAEAIAIQNACNPLGLTKTFGQVTQELADRLREQGAASTSDICRHPIFRLWASKLHDLAGMGISDTDRYGQAYEACRELAEEKG
jgi:hypothetical protein